MALLDLMGQRWTLRVIWELHQTAPLTFRALQQRCDDMSSSVLNRRLHVLREVCLVAVDDAGYELTEHGQALVSHLLPLVGWSQSWADAVDASTGPCDDT